MSRSLRAPGRAALAVVVAVSAAIAVIGGGAGPAAAACAGGNRTINGTVEGQDGRFVSAQVSFVLFDSAGREIGMDGCVRSGGYAATVNVNMKPGTTCCFILPATGATSSPFTDSTGTYNLTRNWSLSGIPNNAVDVWIETYTKRSGGQPNTSTARYGHAMRRLGSISSAAIHIDQPLRCELGGSTGSLTGRVFDNGTQVTASRVSAFSTSPDDGNGGSIIGFNVLTTHPSGRYRIDALPRGTYSIFVTAGGTTRRIDGLRVNDCAETTADVAVRGTVPAYFGQPVSGDWDGDGDDEPGWFFNGQWYLRSDAAPGGSLLATFTYGTSPGDRAVAGDWDGDGDDEPGIFRAGGQWHLRTNASTNGTTLRTINYGAAAGDLPAPGDWDGDGDDEPGIFRRGGEWHLRPPPTNHPAHAHLRHDRRRPPRPRRLGRQRQGRARRLPARNLAPPVQQHERRHVAHHHLRLGHRRPADPGQLGCRRARGARDLPAGRVAPARQQYRPVDDPHVPLPDLTPGRFPI